MGPLLHYPYDAQNYFLVVSLSSLKITLKTIFNYSNQGGGKLFVSINGIKNSCLVPLLIFVNFREAQERKGFLETVEQRACEETL